MAMAVLNGDGFLDAASWEASDFTWDPRKLVAAPASAGAAAAQPYIKQPLQMPVASGSGSESETGVNTQIPSPSGGVTPTSPPVLVRRFQSKTGMPAGACSNICRVQGCEKNLNGEKAYYKRYSICEEHLRSLSLIVDGKLSRFCFQCGKFEGLENFEGDKRSCRTQLQEHNKRRRKGGVLRRQSRRGRKATGSSPVKVPKKRGGANTFDDDTDMGGTDTAWAGQQRTLQAAKQQVVAPMPLAPVGLQMDDLLGPAAASGPAVEYVSSGMCVAQQPTMQASVFASASAFGSNRSTLSRAGPSTLNRMPSAFDPFEEALSKFALESGCGNAGDVDVAACGMLRTNSARDAALFGAACAQPVVSLPEPAPLVADFPVATGEEAGVMLQPRHSSNSMELVDQCALISRLVGQQGLSSGSFVAPLTEGVFTGESFTGGRSSAMELARGAAWQGSGPMAVWEAWQAPAAGVLAANEQQEGPVFKPLQSFHSEPVLPRERSQIQRPLAPQLSGPALNSPFTSLASAPLQAPPPANTAAPGAMAAPAAASGPGLGGMGSLSFACSLQRALSGGSLQRALSASLFNMPSLPLDSVLGRNDSLLPPVQPLPMPQAEAGVSFAAAQKLVAGCGGTARYTPSELNIRLAMKLPNCTPDQLPPDMHAALGRALAAGDMTLMQGFLRPGCVQLVVDVRKRLPVGKDMEPEALEELLVELDANAINDISWRPLADLLASANGSSVRRNAVLQLGGAGAVISNGKLHSKWQGGEAPSAPSLMWAGPCCVVSEPGCAVVVAGNGLCSEGLKMFARSQGVFLSTTASPAVPTRAAEPHLPNSSILLQLDAPPASGLAWVEFEHGKLLSRPVPLLLVDDAHMATELSDGLDPVLRFGGAADRAASEQLLVDIGLLLDYHAAWERATAAGPAGGLAVAVPPVQAAPVGDAVEEQSAAAALSPVGAGLALALQQRRVQGTAAARRAAVGSPAAEGSDVEATRGEMVGLACRVLQHCCERGWQHTCGRIVAVLLALGCSFAEVVAATAGSDALTLLHRAVRSGSAAMVAAVLRWGEQRWYKWEWQTPGPWGLTPLHLAAALRDEGQLAELLLNRHPEACRAWLSAAAVDGQTPAQHAAKLGLEHLNEIARLGTMGLLVASLPSSQEHAGPSWPASQGSDTAQGFDGATTMTDSYLSGASDALTSSAGFSGGALARAAGRSDACQPLPLVEDLFADHPQLASEPAPAHVAEAAEQAKGAGEADAYVKEAERNSKGQRAVVQCSSGLHVAAAAMAVLLLASAVLQVLRLFDRSPWCVCKGACLLVWGLLPSLLLSSAKAKSRAQCTMAKVVKMPGDCATALRELMQDGGSISLQMSERVPGSGRRAAAAVDG